VTTRQTSAEPVATPVNPVAAAQELTDLLPADLDLGTPVPRVVGLDKVLEVEPAKEELEQIVPDFDLLEGLPQGPPAQSERGEDDELAGALETLRRESHEALAAELGIELDQDRLAQARFLGLDRPAQADQGAARVIHAAAAFAGEGAPLPSSAPAVALRSDLKALYSEFQAGLQQALPQEDHHSHMELGTAFKEMDLIEDAIQEFTLASAAPALREPAARMAGICCMQAKRHGQAIEWFRRALDACGDASRQAELQQLLAKARELHRGRGGGKFKVSVLS
jgi:tetratricopeptide (TPR) repeat protein